MAQRKPQDHIAYYRPSGKLLRLLAEMERLAQQAERAE